MSCNLEPIDSKSFMDTYCRNGHRLELIISTSHNFCSILIKQLI